MLFVSLNISAALLSEDIVVARADTELQMLGAIRAYKKCIECHAVRRGTLLGAFTYRFVRQVESPQPQDDRPRKKKKKKTHRLVTHIFGTRRPISGG